MSGINQATGDVPLGITLSAGNGNAFRQREIRTAGVVHFRHLRCPQRRSKISIAGQKIRRNWAIAKKARTSTAAPVERVSAPTTRPNSSAGYNRITPIQAGTEPSAAPPKKKDCCCHLCQGRQSPCDRKIPYSSHFKPVHVYMTTMVGIFPP